MTLGSLVLAAFLVFQSSPADTLRLLAQHLHESALVLEIRSRPLAVRDAVAEALRGAVKETTASARDDQLAVAGRLAAAYAVGWRDSFLVRQVARFTAWQANQRASKVWADSVRRAGIVAYGRDGPVFAIAIWRRALRRARAIGDSAGVGALLGNIGAGFLEDGQLDSASHYLERAQAIAARRFRQLGHLSADAPKHQRSVVGTGTPGRADEHARHRFAAESLTRRAYADLHVDSNGWPWFAGPVDVDAAAERAIAEPWRTYDEHIELDGRRTATQSLGRRSDTAFRVESDRRVRRHGYLDVDTNAGRQRAVMATQLAQPERL